MKHKHIHKHQTQQNTYMPVIIHENCVGVSCQTKFRSDGLVLQRLWILKHNH